MILNHFKEQFRSVDEIRAFLFKVAIVLLLVNLCGSIGVYFRTSYMLKDSILKQAESYFHLMMITRKWNAEYDGIHVEKKGSVQSNEHLRSVGIEPDTYVSGGRIFTMRNPAVMSREISELTHKSTEVQFLITSTLPINPANSPTPFEQKAFASIENGSLSAWEIDSSEDA